MRNRASISAFILLIVTLHLSPLASGQEKVEAVLSGHAIVPLNSILTPPDDVPTHLQTSGKYTHPVTTAEVLGRIKFRGIGSIEFKLDNSSGRYFIIEPNIGRPVTRIGLVEAAGVPILYMMYCDASGLPLPSCDGQRYAGVKWISLHQDIRSAWAYYRMGRLSLGGWLKSLYGVKSFAVLSMRDPLPFISLIYGGFIGFLKTYRT